MSEESDPRIARARLPAPIVIVLPYPVSANRYWRSFIPRGGKRAVTVVSDEAKAYRKDVAWRAHAAGFRNPLTGRVAMRLRLFPARPKDWAKRSAKDPDGWDDSVRCIDLGNAEKVLCDALNGVAWVDDKQIRDMHLVRCVPDEHGPRVEVTIESLACDSVAPGLFAETG